jgi:hypothetical protein
MWYFIPFTSMVAMMRVVDAVFVEVCVLRRCVAFLASLRYSFKQVYGTNRKYLYK